MALKKIIFLSLLICAILAGAFFLYFHKAASDEDNVFYGNVDIHQVDLAFRVGGKIVKMNVEEGAAVTPGQILAELDDDVFAAVVAEARSNLKAQSAALEMLRRGYRSEEVEQARARVSAAVAAEVNARTNHARVVALARKNAVSARERDQVVATLKEAQAALKEARENYEMLSSGYREEDVKKQEALVEAAQATVARAEIDLSDARLASPSAGVIQTKAREEGAVVGAAQTVYTLALMEPVWLWIYVNETELGLIKPGMAVKIAVDAAPGRWFAGTVGFISPTAEFTPKTVETRDVRTSLVYRVRIIASDPENVMRQGMPVTVRLGAGD